MVSRGASGARPTAGGRAGGRGRSSGAASSPAMEASPKTANRVKSRGARPQSRPVSRKSAGSTARKSAKSPGRPSKTTGQKGNNRKLLAELFCCYALAVGAQSLDYLLIKHMLRDAGSSGSASRLAKRPLQDLTESSLLFSLCMAVYALGKSTQGALIDTLGAKNGMLLNMLGITLSCLLIAVAESWPVVALGFFVQHFCVSGAFPGASKFIGNNDDFPLKSAAISIFSLSGRVGALLCGLVVPLLDLVLEGQDVPGLGRIALPPAVVAAMPEPEDRWVLRIFFEIMLRDSELCTLLESSSPLRIRSLRRYPSLLSVLRGARSLDGGKKRPLLAHRFAGGGFISPRSGRWASCS